MPTYQYACTECGDRIEVVQRFSDDPLSVCATCGGKLRKVFSPVGIVFKGSGFYRTDSRTGAVSAGAGSAKADAEGSSGSSGSSGSDGAAKADGGSKSEGASSGSSAGPNGTSAGNGSAKAGKSGPEATGARTGSSGTSSKVA